MVLFYNIVQNRRENNLLCLPGDSHRRYKDLKCDDTPEPLRLRIRPCIWMYENRRGKRNLMLRRIGKGQLKRKDRESIYMAVFLQDVS